MDSLATADRKKVKPVATKLGVSKEDVAMLGTPELKERVRAACEQRGIPVETYFPPTQAEVAVTNESPWKLELKAQARHALGRDYYEAAFKYAQLGLLEVNPNAQRPESVRRYPEIAKYVLNCDGEHDEGIFPAIIVSVMGPDEEIVYDGDVLCCGPSVRFYITDGQHRVGGIKKAITTGLPADRLDDDISALLHINPTEEVQQKDFSDVNTHLVKPSKSVTLAFNVRDLGRKLTFDLIDGCLAFKGKVHPNATRITVKHKETWTFAIVRTAVGAMWEDSITPDNFDDRLAEAVEYWNNVDAAIGKVWEDKTSFATNSNAMTAIARLNGHNVDWQKFAALDWSKGGELQAFYDTLKGTNQRVPALTKALAAAVVTE